MAFTTAARLLNEAGFEPQDAETRDHFVRFAHYGLKSNETMESIDLQEGDLLTEAGYTAFRIASVIQGPASGGYAKTVKVRAERPRGWDGTAI